MLVSSVSAIRVKSLMSTPISVLNMRSAVHHGRKTLLGEPQLNPTIPDVGPEGNSFITHIHPLSVCGILPKKAL